MTRLIRSPPSPPSRFAVLAYRFGSATLLQAHENLTFNPFLLLCSRGQPLWRGRIRVIERGSGIPSKCLIRLEDSTSGELIQSRLSVRDRHSNTHAGELFALCPYQPSRSNLNGGVEAVLDSSRYFVLTVVDQVSYRPSGGKIEARPAGRRQSGTDLND